ncbi:hypothetical protein CcaverHIS002_0304900 [Cutaneotrichosporon cavernicola]|uniref:NADP-dependent oxidoreductase domain-containing protein n=1 Tax=Cutaneotrichosporon cavernicola TaxID=279322 RepID=A0AA48I3G0_9TREE|nr:uncharacterized protein CcaverHIS019_0304860 [Cutaneotrichosporon cavernicola]BEI82622.1 hypothetical protein CcaverHIS002_0304900 [Cutaneotrichosporon cavernicola]BEI90416.1 hypothetical protein CcaverHIS019_0304860 [Cutaneotrichosporon cavernicola]BEI98191.1 hypothetical protein CcaverHIS631_0304900 [Cutaneotrichosporon cavernicola]BEJ05967.1 hypothetical protein CcaverHIS641_0304890 [Cutaneotrichosporon cavernicola]
MPKTLAFQDIQVPVPGFGAMGLSQGYGPADEATSMKTLKHTLDIGCTFWDTAVVYGKGHNETLLGQFIKENNCRDKLFIASKCGFDIEPPPGTEFSMNPTNKAEHIASYIEKTRERLGSYPDLYYLHRMDPTTPLEESIGALQKLKDQGKTKYIGLSECGADTLRKACAIAHIDALQIEYSPWFTDHEQSGLIATAKELGVTIIAFSPLGKGVLTGSIRSTADFKEGDIRKTIPRFDNEHLPANLKLVDAFVSLAEKKGCTPAQLSLAWVMAQGAIPIPGTKTSSRVDENFAARNVVLSAEEEAEIRKLIEEAKPAGNRYSDFHMKLVGR